MVALKKIRCLPENRSSGATFKETIKYRYPSLANKVYEAFSSRGNDTRKKGFDGNISTFNIYVISLCVNIGRTFGPIFLKIQENQYNLNYAL